jgi:hypothetical protein
MHKNNSCHVFGVFDPDPVAPGHGRVALPPITAMNAPYIQCVSDTACLIPPSCAWETRLTMGPSGLFWGPH